MPCSNYHAIDYGQYLLRFLQVILLVRLMSGLFEVRAASSGLTQQEDNAADTGAYEGCIVPYHKAVMEWLQELLTEEDVRKGHECLAQACHRWLEDRTRAELPLLDSPSGLQAYTLSSWATHAAGSNKKILQRSLPLLMETWQMSYRFSK